MYPNLSYILHDLFGTRPDNWTSVIATFGLMLVIAVIMAALVLRSEMIRKENQGILKSVTEKYTIGQGIEMGPLLSNLLWGFFIGFKIVYLLQNYAEIVDPMSFIFSLQGDWVWGVVMALVFGGFYAYGAIKDKLPEPKEVEKVVKPSDRVWDIAVLSGISGVVGAKLFAGFESVEGFRQFIRNPVDHLLSGSGLAIYGGLIVAFIVVAYYVRRKGMPVIHMMDACAPSIIVGYGVGRLGCQLSGDGDWGIVNSDPTPSWWFLPDSFWSFDYPRNVLNEGVKMADCSWNYCSRLVEGVYPTPIYEMAMCAIIFGILWALRKKITVPGVIFFIFMILNGIERSIIEKIRVNPKMPFLGMEMTQAEIIALFFIIIGIVGIIVCNYTFKNTDRPQSQNH